MESHTSTICVPCFRSINHGSRCSVNELEGTVGIRIPTTSSVTTGAREGPTEPVRTDPHCPKLATGDLVPTILRDVGTISTPDTQHSSVTIPALRSDPSRYVQSPATHMESIRDTLCSRDRLVDFASHVSRPQRESTLAIYKSKWRIFTAWCNIQHINPLSATESVVSDFLLHLHMERHLAISTIAGYQMAIANTLRATSSAEVGRNPALKSLLRNIEMEQAPSTSFSKVESHLSFLSIDKTTFRTGRPKIWSAAYMEDSFPHRAYFRQRRDVIYAFEHARIQRTCHSYHRRKFWARAWNVCFHAQFRLLTISWAMALLKTDSCS